MSSSERSNRPGQRRRLQQVAHFSDEFGRRDVVMHVDTMQLGGCCNRLAALRRWCGRSHGACGGGRLRRE
jgi:hypothetical protein